MISKILQILNLQPRISKVFSQSLEHFFFTVGQNNLGNKIPCLSNKSGKMDTFCFFVTWQKHQSNPSTENQLSKSFLVHIVVWCTTETEHTATWLIDLGNGSPEQPCLRDIHIECSKQFKWNLSFYVSGQSRLFWAVLKLL